MNGVGTFAQYAKKYSEDKESSSYGGDLGTFYMNQLDPAMREIVSNLKAGEISTPKRIDYGTGNYGYHIVLLEKRVPQHQANLDEDYQEIKKLTDNWKKQKEYNDWIDQLKKNIYWKVLLTEK